MQILSNLFSNAFKYTGAGGHVLVTLAREAEGVKLTVTDNGIGIPKGELERVFEKFYQVDNSATRTKGGTGLGLAITKELVALHRGRIWVESEEGRGCSFSVLFPAIE
jgi:two-component system sensor histidine kinase VicK